MTKPAPSLGNYVYQQLLQQICVDNLYAIGAKLPPEERLAKEFGVSRPVVRIALAQLRTEGIIQSRQGSGSYVIRTSQGAVKIDQVDNWSDINQFYEYRAHLARSQDSRLNARQRKTASGSRKPITTWWTTTIRTPPVRPPRKRKAIWTATARFI